jgi:hypothetical protein
MVEGVKAIAPSMLEEKRREGCSTCKVKSLLIRDLAKKVEYLFLEIG